MIPQNYARKWASSVHIQVGNLLCSTLWRNEQPSTLLTELPPHKLLPILHEHIFLHPLASLRLPSSSNLILEG